MRNYLNGLAGLLIAGANNRMNRKTLRKIQEANEMNQGIIRYRPSQIEAFIEDTVPVESMLFSGGSNTIRVRAMLRAIECACIQGYMVLVLHCGNSELEQGLSGYFGSSNVCIVNKSNPIYDPFAGATNAEIARLVVSSTSKNNRINSAGRYYLNGVSDYIRSNHKSPRCYMFIKCPHLTLIDRVNDAESQGRISSKNARMIISQIMQGETERGGIENFFHELSLQANAVLATKSNAAYAVSLMEVAKRQQIFSLDTQSGSNTLLLNLLTNETEAIISQGCKMLIVVDGIKVDASEALMNYIKRAGSSNGAIISSDDTFAEFGGSDNDFFAFAGKCSKLVISKHLSAYSCQKLSDAIGFYDKQEVSSSYSRNVNYYGRWGVGSGQTENISIKRENIVKPEEIQRLNNDEVYILDKYSGELSYTSVV